MNMEWTSEKEIVLKQGNELKPKQPKFAKPFRTIQDAYLEVFFKGAQKINTNKDKTIPKFVEKIENKAEDYADRQKKREEYLRRKATRNSNQEMDPLDIKHHREKQGKNELQKISDDLQQNEIQDEILFDNTQEGISQNKVINKFSTANKIDVKAEMIPLSIRNKKNKK